MKSGYGDDRCWKYTPEDPHRSYCRNKRLEGSNACRKHTIQELKLILETDYNLRFYNRFKHLLEDE